MAKVKDKTAKRAHKSVSKSAISGRFVSKSAASSGFVSAPPDTELEAKTQIRGLVQRHRKSLNALAKL